MPDLLRSVLIFSVSITTAFLVLPKLRLVASKIDLLDYPSKRKVHVQPKPLIGGLGIITAISISGVFFMPFAGLHGLYAGMILLAVVGLLDDFNDLNHRWKFAAQVLAAASMIYFSGTVLFSFGDLLGIGPIGFPAGLRSVAVLITIVCTVGVVNAVNMIDGLDGLLGGVSLIAFISFSILAFINNQTELMLLSIAFSGALIAFLRYNWQLSEVFMGDAGSLSVGFTLVFLSIAITQKEHSAVPPVVPLLMLAVPIVDTIAVMIKRMMKGKNPFRADKNHFHHILLRFGFTKKNAVKFILSLSAGLASLGIIGTILKISDYYLFSIFLIYAGLYILSAVYVKDVLKAKMRMKRGRMERGKHGSVTILIVQTLEMLRKIKRKYERHFLKTPVICSHQERSFGGTVSDIGGGGFSAIFNRNRVLEVGQRIDAHMLLMEADKAVRFTATAEVVWSQRSRDWYSHGFQFVGLNQEQAVTLKSFLGKTAVPLAGDALSDFIFGDVRGGQVMSKDGAEKAVMDKSGTDIQETIELAEVRCSLVFEKGYLHDEFDSMLSDYRRWGFCADGRPDITITVKKTPVPRPGQLAGNIFYHALNYGSVSATMVFDAEMLNGEIGITLRETDILTPVRVMELIETFLSTAYLFYFFLHGRGTFIHSSAIADGGTGYIFAGPSGNGKSTLARLSLPRTVLCDDLVVLRKDANGTTKVFGTPFSGDLDSVNKGEECTGLFFIEKSDTTEIVPMTRMSAVIELMKEGVIGNFLSLPEIERVFPYSRLLSHLIDLLEGVPCYKLRFRKDDSFWEVIHGQHRQTAEKT